MKKILVVVMSVMMTTLLYANDIYVTQSGASLDLDITQDGQNNTVGNSSTASSSTGATTILDIDQVGNSNVIKYQINGATYTGQINLQGNSNDVDLNCDSGGSNSSCGSANAVISFIGNSNDIDLDIGQTSAATSADSSTAFSSGSEASAGSTASGATSALMSAAALSLSAASAVLVSRVSSTATSCSAGCWSFFLRLKKLNMMNLFTRWIIRRYELRLCYH